LKLGCEGISIFNAVSSPLLEIRGGKNGSEQESVKASDFRGVRDRDAVGQFR
jgi:hypothetical protein